MTIDVRARRAERWFGVLGLLGVIGAAVLLSPLYSTLAAGVFIAVLALALAGLWLHGWLGGPHRWARIARLPDGSWRLRDARHTDVIAELRGDSRVGARWVWLRWNAESAWMRGRPSMLLIQGDIPAADLRRLRVELRVNAHSQSPETPVRDDDF